jgi:hypothetical protein
MRHVREGAQLHRRRLQQLLSFGAFAGTASLSRFASADTLTWQAGAGNWFSSSNWIDTNTKGNAFPGAGDTADINDGGQAQIESGSATADVEYLGDGSSIEQSGGTHTIGAYVTIGGQGGGSYYLSAGTLSATVLNSAYFNVTVGYNGDGFFLQTGGANNVAQLGVAVAAGSDSSYSFSSGSISTQNECVGYAGTGVFTQSGGTHTITTDTLDIGTEVGAIGTYILTGTGSLLLQGSSGYEIVGDSGVGTFTQNGGTNSITGSSGMLVLAFQSGSTGTYSLSGTGSLSAPGEAIGDLASGFFAQSGGTNTVSGNLSVADQGGSNGAYTLSSGSLSVGGIEYVGRSASGTFNQTGGSNQMSASSGGLKIGYNSTGIGLYSLSGNASVSTTYESIGYQGTGTFDQSGGSNIVTYGIYVGDNTSTAMGTYSLSGSGMLSALSETVGESGTGTFAQSGGTNSISSALVVANYAQSAGTYLLGGNGFLSVNGDESIGESGNGTFNQTGGTNTLEASSTLALTVGDVANGTYSLSGGTLTVSGSQAYPGNLIVGNQTGGNGIFTLSATGSMTTEGEDIGVNGRGAFIQSGGTNVLSGGGDLSIAQQTGSTGTYTLNGGTLTAGTVYVGGYDAGSGGTGSLSVSGSGSLSANSITVYATSATAINVSGGTTTAGTLNLSGSYTQSSGTATFGQITGSGNITTSGGKLALNTDLLSNAATLTSSGTTTLGFDIGASNSSELVLTTAIFNSTPMLNFTVSGPAASGTRYVILSADNLSDNGYLNQISMQQETIGGETITPSFIGGGGDPGQIIVTVTVAGGGGGPHTGLYWDNAGAIAPDDGKTWDTTSYNWKSGNASRIYANGDPVTFNDTNNGNYNVTLNTTVSPASVTVSNSSNNYSITGSGNILDTGSFIKSGTGTLTFGTGLTASSLSINQGAVVVASNTTLDSASSASNVTLPSLSINPASYLDITNNHIIINYTTSDPISTIVSYIQSGYNNGNWNGPGIISSTAATNHAYTVGWADGNDGTGNIAGLSSGEIELKYTLLGDANLDGTVNGSDFSILAANFGKGVTNWDQGNFLFSSSVNGSDFSALAANFGQGDDGADATVSQADIDALDAFAIANHLPLPTIAAVPEPACALLLSAAMTGALLRRRRKPA